MVSALKPQIPAPAWRLGSFYPETRQYIASKINVAEICLPQSSLLNKALSGLSWDGLLIVSCQPTSYHVAVSRGRSWNHPDQTLASTPSFGHLLFSSFQTNQGQREGKARHSALTPTSGLLASWPNGLQVQEFQCPLPEVCSVNKATTLKVKVSSKELTSQPLLFTVFWDSADDGQD